MRGAQFLEMLARFVNGFAAFTRGMPANRQSLADLFAKNSLRAMRRRLPRFQSVAHASLKLLLSREPNVAVALHARDLRAEPRRRFKSSAIGLIFKFHFRDDEALVYSTVNIDLNRESLPRNVDSAPCAIFVRPLPARAQQIVVRSA